jgi:hypothetical protein
MAKYADLFVEHHKKGAAYRQVKMNSGQNPQSDLPQRSTVRFLMRIMLEKKLFIEPPRVKRRGRYTKVDITVQCSAKQQRQESKVTALSKNEKPSAKRKLRAASWKNHSEEQKDDDKNKGVTALSLRKQKHLPKWKLWATTSEKLLE